MELDGASIVALQWSMVVMCVILTCMRIYIRVFCRGFWTWSDAFVVLACASIALEASVNTVLLRTGFFATMATQLQLNPDDPAASSQQPTPQENSAMISWLKIIYAADIIYYNVMYAVKASMILFYFEIIPPVLPKLYFALWGTACLTVIGYITEVLLFALGCLPVSKNWSLDPTKACMSADHTWVLAPSLSLHLLTDIIIYCLPIPLIRVLSLPRRQKMGIGLIFAIGLIDIVFAISTIAMRFSSEQVFVAWIFSVMEQAWAIVVVCLPAFKAFLTRDLRKGLRKVWQSGKNNSSDAEPERLSKEMSNSSMSK